MLIPTIFYQCWNHLKSKSTGRPMIINILSLTIINDYQQILFSDKISSKIGLTITLKKSNGPEGYVPSYENRLLFSLFNDQMNTKSWTKNQQGFYSLILSLKDTPLVTLNKFLGLSHLSFIFFCPMVFGEIVFFSLLRFFLRFSCTSVGSLYSNCDLVKIHFAILLFTWSICCFN